MKKIIPTILLTSAFWLILYILIAPKAENQGNNGTAPDDSVFADKYETVETECRESVKQLPAQDRSAAKGAAKPAQKHAEVKPSKQTNADYSGAITGRWEPAEGAKCPLEFSKYGTLIQWVNPVVDDRYEYSLEGDRLKTWNSKDTRLAIFKEGDNTYLEIFNNTELSGKYRLSKKAPEVDAEDVGAENYRTAIVGKWQPVFGTKNPLEFSKYGTLIQWVNPVVDDRYEYSLEGDRLKTWNSDNTRVVISRNAKGTYLEIYGNKELSGLYRKQ